MLQLAFAYMSTGNANAYLKKIYEKPHIHSAAEAVQRAILQKIM